MRRQIRNLADRISNLEKGNDPDYQMWRSGCMSAASAARSAADSGGGVRNRGSGAVAVLTILHTADLHLGTFHANWMRRRQRGLPVRGWVRSTPSSGWRSSTMSAPSSAPGTFSILRNLRRTGGAASRIDYTHMTGWNIAR